MDTSFYLVSYQIPFLSASVVSLGFRPFSWLW